MRYRGIAAGVALGAALGLSLGTAHWPVGPERVRRSLADALGTVELPAAATLTLLPRPTLRFKDLRIANGALSATAADAEVTLRFDRLLGGALAPSGLTLRGVVARVDFDAAAAALGALAGPPLLRLSLQNATLDLVSARRGFATHVDLAVARLDWPSAGGALSASATGRWRGQPVEASLALDAPLLAAQGGTSGTRASLDAPLAQLRIAGDWSPLGARDGALFRGQATALVPSLSRFARWLGRAPPPGLAPIGVEFAARLTADANQTRMADASLTLAGQPFEGDLALTKAPTGAALSGTLAADAIDLEALVGPPPALLDASGAWSTAPALPDPLAGLDLDLRVSAGRAVWRDETLENAAVAVSQRDGRLSLKLLDAQFAHGDLTGEMSVADAHGVCESRLSLSLENVDVGGWLANRGERNFAGQGGAKVSLRARGRSPAEIVASADGEVSLDLSDGVLRNFNFEEALRRGQRRLIDVARDMNVGVTRFGSARGRVEVSGGQARFVDVATKAPGVTLLLSGATDLVGRQWDARVTARQSSDDGAATPDGAHLEFALRGPWSEPSFAPLIPPAD